ncbi:hypothetical protein Vafri_9013, partial [Volvox africanus]
YVPTAHGAASDKPAGVVALTCFELRRQGLVDRIVLCDMYGRRMPEVRATVQRKIADVYDGLDTCLECFPEDDVDQEATAYLRALDTMSPGDAVIIFVPDDLHASVAVAAAERRLHVLLAKPAVKTLDEHRQVLDAVAATGVLACVEFHKRWDIMYSDARNRARQLGPFSHFSALMTQPKQQLDTFRLWAGLRSDISYYLNSHHIDLHSWMVGRSSRPERVVAMAATGVAEQKLGRPCEDTISLMVQWRNGADGSYGTALYTASWVAAKGDCHTQQGFFYMGQKGEMRVDQAHRGYSGASDTEGYASYNPLYMRYTPDANGRFAGQSGYGFMSIAAFLKAAGDLNRGVTSLGELRRRGELAMGYEGPWAIASGAAPMYIKLYGSSGIPSSSHSSNLHLVSNCGGNDNGGENCGGTDIGGERDCGSSEGVFRTAAVVAAAAAAVETTDVVGESKHDDAIEAVGDDKACQ